MNKLEEIHIKPLDVINPFSPYDVNRDCQRAKDNSLMAQKSAEITTDIAVKFAEWIDNMGYRQVSNSFYKSLLDINGKTSQELFEEFINNHYQITL
jgi:hypothetical protein